MRKLSFPMQRAIEAIAHNGGVTHYGGGGYWLTKDRSGILPIQTHTVKALKARGILVPTGGSTSYKESLMLEKESPARGPG